MASRDLRSADKPISRQQFTQLSWATGAGHAAQTATIKNLSMLIERIDVIISSVTANPTVTVTFSDENSAAPIDHTNLAALADGTKHVLLSTKATPDFAAVPVCGNLTVSADPSADPGGAGQELTVDVILYGP